jgi:hypothetical protein
MVVVVDDFIIDSVQKLQDTPSYMPQTTKPLGWTKREVKF